MKLSSHVNSHDCSVDRTSLQEADFLPTQEDKDSISHGMVPPQLMVDGCHFKKEGYRIIAQLVKQKIDRFK